MDFDCQIDNYCLQIISLWTRPRQGLVARGENWSSSPRGRICSLTRLLRKGAPSAKADSVCSTLAFPALPCRAFRCGRSAAGAQLSSPSLRSTEFVTAFLGCGLHSYAASQLITWSWFRCVGGDGRGRLSSNKNSGSRTQWCDEGQLIQIVLRYAGRSEGQLGDC